MTASNISSAMFKDTIMAYRSTRPSQRSISQEFALYN